MTDKSGDYRNGRHVVYNLSAHLVLVTKYRRGVITDRVREDIIQTTRETCARHDVVVEAIDGENDHIRMVISYPPKVAMSNLVAAIKATTSKAVRARNYPEVKRALYGGAFWSPSYFVSSTGGDSLVAVKQYVENQRSPNRKVGRPAAVSSPPKSDGAFSANLRVTRHLRSNSSSVAGFSMSAPEPPALAVIDGLFKVSPGGVLIDHYNDESSRYNKTELASVMQQMFSARILKDAAEMFAENNGLPIKEWLCLGLADAAEDRLDHQKYGGTYREVTDDAIKHYENNVQLARVLTATGKYQNRDQKLTYLMKRSETHATSLVQDLVRDGDMPTDGKFVEEKQREYAVSMTLLNSIFTSKQYSAIKAEWRDDIDYIYPELDRILPYLEEFQRRETFSFGLLEELESSSAGSLNSGLL